MKKVLFIIVCTITLVSCGPRQPIEGSTKTKQIGGFDVIEIDGCEYLEYSRGGGETAVYSLTHKGNCKNHEKF